ncbi:MAG: putative membrane protein, partial [Gammaproteobacteria bacterium]
MEVLILVAVLVIGFLCVGSILAFTNLSNMRTLKTDLKKVINTVIQQNIQIATLLKTVDLLKTEIAKNDHSSDNLEANTWAPNEVSFPNTIPKSAMSEASSSSQFINPTNDAPATSAKDSSLQLSSTKVNQDNSVSAKTPVKPKISFSLDTFLMGNGLLWLGAAVLALGGVFLAKYSIEAGLFPPSLRIIIGACFGVLLVCIAEYLYIHPRRFQINSSMISAALASGGVITCFAMTLVAFDFYAFISPLVTFITLAVIATAATWLSIRYGPILALVGVVGAYIVPGLVSTGTNNVFALLLYVSFISISTLWVHAYVKQSWLWWLSVVGHFGWLFIGIAIGNNNYQWVIFTYCLLSIYLFVLAPVLGLKLNQTEFNALPVKSLLMPRKEQLGIVLPVIALVLMNFMQTFQSDLMLMLAILSTLLLLVPFRHSALDSWPFISLGLCVLVFLKMPISYDYTDNLFPFTNGYLLIQVCAAGFVIYSMFALRLLKYRPSFLLLLVLSPILLMGLAYALSVPEAVHYLYPVWSIELMLLACVYAYLGTKASNNLYKMTYLMLANGALTLTFTMLLSAATLTLAIVAQIALLTFFSNKYRILLPNWLYKMAVALVLLRLTAAPWLQDYTGETIFGLHWSIVIYPLVLALFGMANKFQQKDDLKAWFTGAILHVVALFVTTQTSYLLVGSYLNLFDLDYKQSILLSMNWLILATVYLWRKKITSRPILYWIYSILLMSGSALLHIYLTVVSNPFLVYQETGTGALINWLLPLWAVPAAMLGAILYWRLLANGMRKTVWALLSFFTVLYINGLIRGLYHPALSFNEFDIGQQELYVYSIVWLIIAVALIIYAQNFGKALINKVGFGILALVVLKAFLIDLSNLDGLYRALSFIGLGLCLVGIGWLFQRFKNK